MKKAPDPFKGKHVLVFCSGADCVAATTWLLDREVRVTITDRAGIRSIQGHLRATASDGEEYERRKGRLDWVDQEEVGALLTTIDLVVSRMADDHPLIRQVRERGIQIVSRGELAGAFPLPPRQQVIQHSDTLTIVNDTGAISPERGVLSVQQWGGPNCILIAGGDGEGSDYGAWADIVAEKVRATNLIFLAGSATNAMRAALGKRARGIRTYDSLAQCWEVARKRSALFVSSVVLFSPAAKSFELFANEFDRGQQFNALISLKK